MAISYSRTMADKTRRNDRPLPACTKRCPLFATNRVRELGRKLVCAVVLLLSAGNAGSADLIVSAAASLTNAFTAIGEAFEQAYPETTVAMNFAGSGQLLQQIARGAPVDVFASADQITMNRAQQDNLIRSASRRDFVRNELVLIGPAGSNPEINSLGDLRSDKVQRIAISNPASVPVGHYSQLSLQAAGLWEALAEKYINTQHVRQSLDYVARGEVDAGFVYATDARVMPGKIRVLMQVPTAEPITYPIAVVADSRQAEAAERFVTFVHSGQGQVILRQFGFGAPDAD
jgi:molybdate transport system substrate-binding protein